MSAPYSTASAPAASPATPAAQGLTAAPSPLTRASGAASAEVAAAERSATTSSSGPLAPQARAKAGAPVLLALDTATDRIHAALIVGDTTLTLDLPGGALASSTLLPALAGLLQQAGRVWADLDAIAFGCGPGAFTGLRTACSITQGLALGLGCPVIAIDTLMAVAEDARLAAPAAWQPGDTMWVLQDARMDELYVSAFAWQDEGWQPLQPPRLWALSEPAHRWASVDAPDAPHALGVTAVPRWAGNAARAYPGPLAAVLRAEQIVGEQSVAEPSSRLPDTTVSDATSPQANAPRSAAPRGAALASLARAAWARGDTLDAALALPRYVRDKVAQTTAERAAVQAARDTAASEPPAAPAVRA
jgi:tRNA threonylcarbamoyladenosine biosynthesis protein TsaB